MERLDGEEHFSSNLHHVGNPSAGKLLGDTGNVDDIFGDVFSGVPVSAGCRTNQSATSVPQVES